MTSAGGSAWSPPHGPAPEYASDGRLSSRWGPEGGVGRLQLSQGQLQRMVGGRSKLPLDQCGMFPGEPHRQGAVSRGAERPDQTDHVAGAERIALGQPAQPLHRAGMVSGPSRGRCERLERQGQPLGERGSLPVAPALELLRIRSQVKPVKKRSLIESHGFELPLLQLALELGDVADDHFRIEPQVGGAAEQLGIQLATEHRNRLLERVARFDLVALRPEVGRELSRLIPRSPDAGIAPGARAAPDGVAEPQARRSTDRRDREKGFRRYAAAASGGFTRSLPAGHRPSVFSRNRRQASVLAGETRSLGRGGKSGRDASEISSGMYGGDTG